MSRRANVVRHGDNHRPGGSDPTGPWDSTENVGTDFGVRSRDPIAGPEESGLVLTSDGSGGSQWSRSLASATLSPYRECVTANPDLWVYWPMDDTSGDLQELVRDHDAVRVTDDDLIVYGSDGPFVADFPARTAVTFAGTTGFSGNGDRFHRSLTSDDSSIFSSTSPWTIESWIYPTGVSGVSNNRIFHFWDGTSSPGGVFVNLGPTTAVLVASRGSASVSSGSALTLNTWTHWRVTYDGADLKLYINGSLVDTDADTANFTTGGNYWVIGNTEGPPSFFWVPFTGRISDFAIYSDAVTTFCPTVTSGGPGATHAADGMVLTADGSGGTEWAYPTIEVQYT